MQSEAEILSEIQRLLTSMSRAITDIEDLSPSTSEVVGKDLGVAVHHMAQAGGVLIDIRDSAGTPGYPIMAANGTGDEDEDDEEEEGA